LLQIKLIHIGWKQRAPPHESTSAQRDTADDDVSEAWPAQQAATHKALEAMGAFGSFRAAE
jgi:hypothetical protein